MCYLFKVFYYLHITSEVFCDHLIVMIINKQTVRIFYVFDVTQELSILGQDVNTVVVIVCCKNLTLAICCDTRGQKGIPVGMQAMAIVSESKFSGLFNYNHRARFPVSHAFLFFFTAIYLILSFPE